MSARKSLVGASYLIAQALCLNVLALPVTAYIIRRLGAAPYGEWTTATTLVLIATGLCTFGLRPVFVRRVAQCPERAQDLLGEQLALRLALGGGAALAVVLLCMALRYPAVVVQCTLLGGLGLLFSSVSFTVVDLLQALHRFRAVAAINLAAGFLLTGASVAVAARDPRPVPLAAAYVLGPCTAALLSAWMLRRVGLRIAPRWSLARFRDLLGETRHLAGLQLLAAVQTQAEALLVPKLLGFGQNGLFSAGSLLANRLAIVPDGIGTAYYPVIARSHQRGVGHSAADVLRYLGVSVALCSVAAVGLTLLASPISRILFQEQAAACALVMQISAWSLPLLALSQGLEYCLNAAGREAEQATLGIWAMVPAVGLAVFLVYSFGLVGAAGSLVLRHALFTLFRLPCFLRTFGTGFGAARADLQVGLARAVKQFGLGGQEV